MLFLGTPLAEFSGEWSGKDWSVIGGVIIALVTGFWTWWSNRPKDKNDQFKILMDESAEFREELRREKSSLKDELKAAHDEILMLQTCVKDYQKRVADYQVELDSCKRELMLAKQDIELFTVKIAAFKDQVKKCENCSKDYDGIN